MLTPPETIVDMLRRYPRLWVEISHRGDVAPKGKLSPQWRELMMLYPDRLLLGTGTYSSEYWYQFRYNLGGYRKWIQDLPADVAHMIAYENGLRLFGLDMSYKSD
jgi:hypothetical protein